MKQLIIVPKEKAKAIIPKIADADSICYYLSDDYTHLLSLQEKCADRIEIKSISGLVQDTLQEIKKPLLEKIAKINKKYNSQLWWGSRLASHSSSSTPLILNTTYLFCGQKILSRYNEDIIFILDSDALAGCLSNAGVETGYQIVNYRSIISKVLNSIKLWLYYATQIIYYFWLVLKSRRAALALLRPLCAKKSSAKKRRVVIRSWITDGNFKSGKFKDRNFGPLPAWLNSKDYEIWNLPMFFNLSLPIKDVYRNLKDQSQLFLIQDHYLKISDYLKVLFEGYQRLRKRIEYIELFGTEITPIFNEVRKNLGLDQFLLILNLCCPLLNRLREKGFEIDAFYYPFEGNDPEKQFILYCRKYFPGSKIIGFQHTVFFPNQLAYHLGPGEKDYHPLPDKVVCSGQIYIGLLKQAGFPPEILAHGPNLRFDAVYMEKPDNINIVTNKRKMLLLPLTFSHNLAFELFVKVKNALKEIQEDYEIGIRSHPLLSKNALVEFLDKIGMKNYKFTDNGTIQDWLPKVYAVITTGGSITIIESVVMGTPAIRVIPDYSIFYDPFTWEDYPLKPVSTSEGINQQLQLIDRFLTQDKNIFLVIGKQVLTEYFEKPTEENMKVFSCEKYNHTSSPTG